MKRISLEKTTKYLFYFFLVLKIIESLCLLPHGDPLYYHLVGPRIWLEDGWLALHHFIPWMQSGYFDYLYVIPTLILGAGLLTHICGQFLQFSLGQGLVAIVGQRLFPSDFLGYLFGLIVLTMNKSSDFFLYAKNDGVMAATYFLTMVLALRKEKPTQPFYLGLLLGLIPAIKMTGLFYTLPLGLYLLWQNRKNNKPIFLICSGALLAFTPILLRNYLTIGNPFFPGLIKVFPGILTDAMRSYYLAHMGSALTTTLFFQHLQAYFGGKLVLYLAPILFIYLTAKRRTISPWFALPLTSFALYLMANGGILYERYYFAAYFSMAFFLIAETQDITVQRKVLYWPLLALILVDSKIDKSFKRIKDTFKLYASAPDALTIAETISPVMKLFHTIPANAQVLSDQLSEVYYAKAGVRMIQYSANPDAEFLGRCLPGEENLINHYSFAIMASPFENNCTLAIKKHWQPTTTEGEYTLYANPQK